MKLEHFNKVEAGANAVYHLGNLSTWICENTSLNNRAFSFVNHEYQKDIIDDEAPNVYVNKAAQTGLSEIFARWALAGVCTQEDFTTIWTFPSSSDSEMFCKARLDPVISSSSAIQRALSSTVNSMDLKQFNRNSFLYIRGTKSDTGGLSVPADLLIHDEFDKSDMDNISTYVSRLQHKPTKKRRIFSTPTQRKYGIDLACETAKRKRQVWKCSCCNHTWLPSFELDIKIPGWDKPKKEINKQNLKDIRWSEAVLLCPNCGRAPSPDLKYREWVIENTQDNYVDIGYYVSPFCAPAIISAPYLVNAIGEYKKWSEFQNQALGLTAEDSEETLTETDVRSSLMNADLGDSSIHYMGADMGLMCHIAIGRHAPSGELIVVHRERVGYANFKARRLELIRKFKVATSVHDMFPYTDIINEITMFDPNAYGAVYTEKASTEAFTIREQEEEEEEGKLNVRAVTINRNVAFDELMAEFKAGRIVVKAQEDDELFVLHLQDMKRVQMFDKHGGIVYKWKKTNGNDHYHHAMLYLKTACALRGTISGLDVNASHQLVRKFKLKQA